MSYQIVNLEKKWSEETLPKDKIHKVIIISSKGLLNINECEQGDINFQSNEGEVILISNNGIRYIEHLRDKEIKFFGDFPQEIQSAICQKTLRSAKNSEGIDCLVFEPENESDNERFEVGENPANDYDDIF